VSGGADGKKTLPKGGRKGGKVFPQYPLEDAVKWAAKLVSKTYAGPQTVDVIRASVIEAKSGVANMRISALRQYDLLQGESAAISSTDLAKRIKSAPPEEQAPLLKQAALAPDIFRRLFDTFHGDPISIAKVKQRASELGVHPDSAAKCAEIYSETAVFAGIARREGDTLVHEHVSALGEPASEESVELEMTETEKEPMHEQEEQEMAPTRRRPQAAVQVTIAVDSSLDTDKLEKQLQLLKRFGAL
jgi:hypothetical protein